MSVQYYSQHGEDFLLDQLIANKANGFFVEVGCIDGMRFSNTLTFEKRGWRGICVEAHPEYIEALKVNRPSSEVVHCAVSDSNRKNVPFYTNHRGSLSTLDKSKEADFQDKFGAYFSGFVEVSVEQKTLSTIINDYYVREIDVLSIDVEGTEYDVLRGLNIGDIKPKIIIIECDSRQSENQIDDLLNPSYSKVTKVEQNIIYSLDEGMIKNVILGNYYFQLTHTPHPLDENKNSISEVKLSTTPTSQLMAFESRSILSHHD